MIIYTAYSQMNTLGKPLWLEPLKKQLEKKVVVYDPSMLLAEHPPEIMNSLLRSPRINEELAAILRLPVETTWPLEKALETIRSADEMEAKGFYPSTVFKSTYVLARSDLFICDVNLNSGGGSSSFLCHLAYQLGVPSIVVSDSIVHSPWFMAHTDLISPSSKLFQIVDQKLHYLESVQELVEKEPLESLEDQMVQKEPKGAVDQKDSIIPKAQKDSKETPGTPSDPKGDLKWAMEHPVEEQILRQAEELKKIEKVLKDPKEDIKDPKGPQEYRTATKEEIKAAAKEITGLAFPFRTDGPDSAI